jgi:integrase/recombinase XerC
VTGASTAELEAARLLLARMGISPDDLLTMAPRALAPTFAEYVPIVSAAVSGGTRRVYGSYWNRVVERWAQRRLDEVSASDIERLIEDVKRGVVVRRKAGGGRNAAEHLIFRVALPLPAGGGRRPDPAGREPGGQGRQAAPVAEYPRRGG